MTSTEAAEQDQRTAAEGDAAAARAGADVEVPATEPPTAAHTTRTLSDTDTDTDTDADTDAGSDTGGAAENFPLTTDEQAQDDNSNVNPGSS